MGVSHFFSKLCGTCCGGMHLARPLSHSTTNGSIAQDAPRTASMTPCWPTASAKPSPTCWASSKTYLHHHPLHAPPHTDLLQRAETDFFSGEPLRALSTLVYSDNIDLQRSASLTFAEITERGTCTCARYSCLPYLTTTACRCARSRSRHAGAHPLPPPEPRSRSPASCQRRPGQSGGEQYVTAHDITHTPSLMPRSREQGCHCRTGWPRAPHQADELA